MTDYSPEASMFGQAGTSPVVWQIVARELICAANVVVQRYSTIEPWPKDSQWPPLPIDYQRFHTSLMPALLLYAFATENLIKAILVAKGRNPTANGSLDKSFKTHNLLRLFREADLTVEKPLESLLVRLQQIIECGKYPIGITPGPYSPSQISSSELEMIRALLQGLEEALRVLHPLVLGPIDLTRLC
ncbi:MAG TPA: hypothetical protein VF647_00655 [Longimicrobium sp.]|jgi:hypothetical protein